jgi:hypothetical protein
MTEPREMLAQAEQLEQQAIEASFGRDKITDAMMEACRSNFTLSSPRPRV